MNKTHSAIVDIAKNNIAQIDKSSLFFSIVI